MADEYEQAVADRDYWRAEMKKCRLERDSVRDVAKSTAESDGVDLKGAGPVAWMCHIRRQRDVANMLLAEVYDYIGTKALGDEMATRIRSHLDSMPKTTL